MSSNATPLSFRIESNYAWMAYGSRRAGATEYRDFPVRLSVPVPRGAFTPKDRLEVRGHAGAPAPAGVTPMLLYPDGSVRIWQVVMPLTLKREETQSFTLGPASAITATPPAPQSPLQPSAFTVTATFADDSTATTTVTFDPPRFAGGIEQATDEQPFELRKGDEPAAFKGAIVRTSWSWYPAIELAIRTINYADTPDEELAVKSLTLGFDLPGKGACRYAIRHAAQTAENPRLVESHAPFVVRSDAGGTHVTDIAQVGRKQTDYAVYERGPYAEAVDPWIGMSDDDSGWLLAIPEASERMPKGWHVHDRRVTVELHPAWAEPLSWRRGMALFQRIHLSRVPRTSTAAEFEDEAYRWLRPPIVTVDAEVYRAAGWRIPFRYEPARFPRTEYTIRDTWGFSWSRGTFDWGDQIQGRLARNLEYDFPACATKEFARTGRTELGKMCRAAAEHMMHTDFVAVSNDPWKHGGVPAHCPRHTTGSAYPSHMWAEGLCLYYQLSGDRYALEIASRLGDFFLQYIDGRFAVIEATGREMGWALVALAAVYDLTAEQRYLDGIRAIVDFYLKAGVKEFFPTDATFTIGVGLIGLDRVRPFHRDAEIKAFILGVLDRILATRVDAIGVFDYWFNSEQKTVNFLNSHLPEALNLGYRLSGDLKYLRAAWRLYQIHEGGGVLTVQGRYAAPECGYAAGYHITWTMGALASFAERGWLDKMQYAAPE